MAFYVFFMFLFCARVEDHLVLFGIKVLDSPRHRSAIISAWICTPKP